MLAYLRGRVTLGPVCEMLFHPLVQHSVPVLLTELLWTSYCGHLASAKWRQGGEQAHEGMWCVGEVCSASAPALSILWRERI